MSSHPPGIIFWTFWARAWDASEANEFNGALGFLYKILLVALGWFYSLVNFRKFVEVDLLKNGKVQ